MYINTDTCSNLFLIREYVWGALLVDVIMRKQESLNIIYEFTHIEYRITSTKYEPNTQ